MCPTIGVQTQHMKSVEECICNSLFHQCFSSNFCGIAPDLHLQKWKQKEELGVHGRTVY